MLAFALGVIFGSAATLTVMCCLVVYGKYDND